MFKFKPKKIFDSDTITCLKKSAYSNHPLRFMTMLQYSNLLKKNNFKINYKEQLMRTYFSSKEKFYFLVIEASKIQIVISLKNKKIAILGTSPIMILLYFRLKKQNFVDVFENLKIGGAWYLDKYKKKYFTPHNNIIVALNNNEEKYIELINKELANFGCKKTKPKGKYQLLTNYIPKNTYIHDLSNLFLQFKKRCNSLKKKK